MIINHEHPKYIKALNSIGKNRWNGAYYYSVEICKNIIPNVITDRNWVTIDPKDEYTGCDHAIVFIHNHLRCPEWYEWLGKYKDLILVCSAFEDMPKLAHIGTPVYLPLSVDIEEVKKYRRPKTKEIAFAGRIEKIRGCDLQIDGVDFIGHQPREVFLAQMAEYRKAYAVDRAEIEARILGCEVIPYGYWSYAPDKNIDNKAAAFLLQGILDEIDFKTNSVI